MEAMTQTTKASIEALISAAGMTCYAEDCDVVVIRRAAPRIPEKFEPASAVSPPFAGD